MSKTESKNPALDKFKQLITENPTATILDVIILVVLGYLLVSPMFSMAWPYSHEIRSYPVRLFEFHENLKYFILFPRWAPDLYGGYGYPIFNFYAPGVFYFAEIFKFLGFNWYQAFKGVVLFSSIFSGLSMYVFAKYMWGRFGGMLSAVAYLYAPFHIIDYYVRGDLAEFVIYIWMPLSLYFFLRFIKEEKKQFLIGAIISYAAIILTHNTSALIFTPFLLLTLLFWLMSYKKPIKSYFKVAGGILLSYGLSAYFWLPALYEKGLVASEKLTLDYFHYSNHFVYFSQFFNSKWGHEFSEVGINDGMSFQIGIVLLELALLALVLYIFTKKEKKNHIIPFSLFLTIICLFLMMESSKFLWDNLPLLEYLQFPWRFMMLVVLFLSMIVGSVYVIIEKWSVFRKMLILFIGIIMVIYPVFGYRTFAKEIETVLERFKKDNIKIGLYDQYLPEHDLYSFTSVDEYVPKTMEVKPEKPAFSEYEIIEGTGNVSDLSHIPNTFKLNTNSQDQFTLMLNHFYFPGWKAKLDGEPTAIEVNENGLMLINIPGGEHALKVWFGDTFIRTVSKTISVLVLVFMIYLSFFLRPEEREKLKIKN